MNEQLMREIADKIKEFGLTRQAVAKKAGIGQTNITPILNRSPSIGTILKIVAAMEELSGKKFKPATFVAEIDPD